MVINNYEREIYGEATSEKSTALVEFPHLYSETSCHGHFSNVDTFFNDVFYRYSRQTRICQSQIELLMSYAPIALPDFRQKLFKL